jgi:hypothetical protein
LQVKRGSMSDNHKGAEMGHRILGVIIAIAIVILLEYFWRVEWYVAVPLSIVGYLIIRYAAYFMKERDT